MRPLRPAMECRDTSPGGGNAAGRPFSGLKPSELKRRRCPRSPRGHQGLSALDGPFLDHPAIEASHLENIGARALTVTWQAYRLSLPFQPL